MPSPRCPVPLCPTEEEQEGEQREEEERGEACLGTPWPQQEEVAATEGGPLSGTTTITVTRRPRTAPSRPRAPVAIGRTRGRRGGRPSPPQGPRMGSTAVPSLGGWLIRCGKPVTPDPMLCGRADEGLHCIPMTLPMWLPLSSA